MAEPTIHRHEVPVDDQWHTLPGEHVGTAVTDTRWSLIWHLFRRETTTPPTTEERS
jgi:hypothetical protein